MTRLTLDWVELVAILGACQGLVLTVVIGAQRANRTANVLLSTLMATMTLYLISAPYYRTPLVRIYPHFLLVSYQTIWVFGPLVYLYARAASDRDWRFRSRHLVHFLPVAIMIAVASPYYIMSADQKLATWDRFSRAGMDGLIGLLDPLKFASGLSYTAAATLYLVRHRRVVEQNYSNIERVSLRWLLWLTAATGFIWVVVSALNVAQVPTPIRDGHVTITMAMVVYGIGYMGLRQPEVFRYESAAPETGSERGVAAPVVQPQPSRYAHSGLRDVEAVRLRDSLLALMDTQQPWKEADLTLTDLSSRLSSTPNKLSQVLNAELGLTFYDFVNGYRVREVQRRIRAGDARSLKMLALAMDAGFASKSTFNDVFKKHTAQSPSDFRQAVGG